jgi:hypothetical protein
METTSIFDSDFPGLYTALLKPIVLKDSDHFEPHLKDQ